MSIHLLGTGLGVIALLVCGACATSGAKAPASVPQAPDAAGRAFYEANGCASCHGKDGGGGVQGPGLRGRKASALLVVMDGTAMHMGGSVEGVTGEAAGNLEAFLVE